MVASYTHRRPVRDAFKNKPKGLKVAKEDQRSIGLMVNRLYG